MVDYALFDRRYELIVNDGTEEKTWAGGQMDSGRWEGFDILFKVVKTADAVPNECDIEIRNLKADHRAWLSRKNLKVTLKAGYRDGYGQIFVGNIELAGHQHEGETWVTKLYCKDSGAALRDLMIFKTWKKGTEITTVIDALLKKLTGLPAGLPAELQKINQIAQGQIDLLSFKPKPAKVKGKKQTRTQAPAPSEAQQKQTYADKKQNTRETAASRQLKRAEILAGAAVKKLQALCDRVGLILIVNDQTLHIFPKGSSLGDEEIVIDQTSGMVGSPEKTADGSRQGGYETVSLLRFEFNPGRPVFIDSLYLSESQVIWRVEHDGSIPGDWRSKAFTESSEAA